LKKLAETIQKVLEQEIFVNSCLTMLRKLLIQALTSQIILKSILIFLISQNDKLADLFDPLDFDGLVFVELLKQSEK